VLTNVQAVLIGLSAYLCPCDSFVNVMEEKSCERGIMLYKKKLTPSAKKVSPVNASAMRNAVSILSRLFCVYRLSKNFKEITKSKNTLKLI
jgi:hypothetical protein